MFAPMASKNDRLFERSRRIIPRSELAGTRVPRGRRRPPFIERGAGSRIWDADGASTSTTSLWGRSRWPCDRRSCCGSIRRGRGLSFGAPTEGEAELAELLDVGPRARAGAPVSSGTEATMSALRLARGATGRSRVVKFEGCYHGHATACW